MTQKIDRRAKRTRRLLGDAVVDLLQAHDLNAISIREITDQADVAYSTFFRHFESKEALLLTHLRGFLAEMQREADAARAQPAPTRYAQTACFFRVMFQQIAAHPTIHHILHRTPSAQPIVQAFKADILQDNIDALTPHQAQFLPGLPPLTFIARQKVGQLFSIIEWWLDNDLKPDAEQMTTYYMQVVVTPLWRLLLGDDGEAFLHAPLL